MTKKTYNPNQGQQDAASGIFQFLMGDEKEACIIGPPGAGKTYLMGMIIDEIMPQYFQMCELLGVPPKLEQVQMTAMTNPAAEVLGRETGQPTSTIHSFMNLIVKDDYDNGKSFIQRSAGWKVHENYILFIDEAGMMDSKLRKHVLEGTKDCKIIYVGDDCQLRSVTEPSFSIFDMSLPTFELTETKRTNHPALLDLWNQFRATVRTGEFQPIKLVPGVIDLLTPDEVEMGVDELLIKQKADTCIIGYTNAKVMDYNDYVRTAQGHPGEYEKDEELVINEAFQSKGFKFQTGTNWKVFRVGTEEVIDLGTNEDGSPIELEVRKLDLIDQYGQVVGQVPVAKNPRHMLALKKHFSSEKDWKRFYKIKDGVVDLRPRHAKTSHKAQGATHDTAFIDLDDIGMCRNPDVAARLLLVALSRVRKRLYLYGSLPKRLGGPCI